MAIFTEEEWDEQNKPKVPAFRKKEKSAPDALEKTAQAAMSAAISSESASLTMAESVIATQGAAKALIDMVEKLIKAPDAEKPEPQPVRLIVNRKNNLIESIDVLPLVKKGK